MALISEVFNEDCMEGMARYPDKFFDLAIVDPPYGIGDKMTSGGPRKEKFGPKTNTDWDCLPSDEYFVELMRISINQVIWGGNYFLDYLASTRCVVIWDKVQEFSGADFELAWTSFDKPAKSFRMSRVEAYSGGKIHICQKPIKLYLWILTNYAKPGQKIIDTHMGSQSSRIAAFQMGFDYWGWELDKDYFDAGCKRFENHKKQLKLF